MIHRFELFREKCHVTDCSLLKAELLTLGRSPLRGLMWPWFYGLVLLIVFHSLYHWFLFICEQISVFFLLSLHLQEKVIRSLDVDFPTVFVTSSTPCRYHDGGGGTLDRSVWEFGEFGEVWRSSKAVDSSGDWFSIRPPLPAHPHHLKQVRPTRAKKHIHTQTHHYSFIVDMTQ